MLISEDAARILCRPLAEEIVQSHLRQRTLHHAVENRKGQSHGGSAQPQGFRRIAASAQAGGQNTGLNSLCLIDIGDLADGVQSVHAHLFLSSEKDGGTPHPFECHRRFVVFPIQYQV